METPQFKGDNVDIFNHETPLYELRRPDMRSLLGLNLSKSLLILGFCLILLNNLNVLAPGTYFGAFSWVMAAVFSIGLCINYVLIPYLYFSSFSNFKKENEFWDKETFWILPLFFFGNFFLYGSQIPVAVYLLGLSIVLIAVVHFGFIMKSLKALAENTHENLASYEQYAMTLKYLTVYYILLIVLTVFYNPLQQFFVLVRYYFS